MKQAAIARRYSPEEADMDQLILLQEPFVVAGGIDHWPARRKWTQDYLKQQIGAASLMLKPGDAPVDFKSFTYAEFLDLIYSDREDRTQYQLHYATSKLHDYERPDEILGVLLSDIVVPDCVQMSRLARMPLWVSAGPCFRGVHFEPNGCHNLNGQVVGRKRIRMFAPSQAGKLDPTLITEHPRFPLNGHETFLPPDWNQVDHDRHPAFRDAEYVEAVLEAGDLLFIPAFWYHWVSHEGRVNINVNFWWSPEFVRLSPISATWVFRNALTRALASRCEVPSITGAIEQLEALSSETRALLQEVERLMACNPAMMTLAEIADLRRNVHVEILQQKQRKTADKP
jgi:Cupin-like domain